MANPCIKYLMFTVNLLIEIAGLTMLCFGVTWYLKVAFAVNMLGTPNDMLCFLMMGVGIVTAVVAFLGCFGALVEIIWMLLVFSVLMLLLLAGKVACVVLVFLNEKWWKKAYKTILEDNEIGKEFGNSPISFQWQFTGFCSAIGAVEVISMVLAFYLVNNIKRCNKNKN